MYVTKKIPTRERDFSVLQNVHTIFEAYTTSCLVGMWPEREAYCPPPPNTDVKNELRYTCIPPPPIYLHGVCRNNFYLLAQYSTQH